MVWEKRAQRREGGNILWTQTHPNKATVPSDSHPNANEAQQHLEPKLVSQHCKIWQHSYNVRARNGIHSISVFAIRSAIYSIFKELQQKGKKKSLTVKREFKNNQCNYLLLEVFLKTACMQQEACCQMYIKLKKKNVLSCMRNRESHTVRKNNTKQKQMLL